MSSYEIFLSFLVAILGVTTMLWTVAVAVYIFRDPAKRVSR